MNPGTEAEIQRKLAESPEAQRQLRHLAIRRAASGSGLIAALCLLLWFLPDSSRGLILRSMAANRLLIGLLFAFGFIATSLLWSKGQSLDVWLFQALNLRGYHALWLDRAMWIATQLGNEGFIALLATVTYGLGDHGFAIALALGALSLLLLVTTIKALTDRARPFNLLRESRVIGFRETGLSFPSGHTAQTFFIATLVVSHFRPPVDLAVAMYIIAALVATTRVYLGVHYPRDVIAGAILGLIWASLDVLVAPYV